ncbi:class III lanthionine synthetase LanKC [Brevibacillus sp. MS2.2]|uniref:class III lanthionine synthetase LanKC n=1 Tax=Brevibacillus sp. MS2.2 TaxID=2738981 RepID=UPI00156AF402|nr:class III lanthionine synthetase LanKC [Brevibacillus sp. MS2.2]NRR23037.1 protein kinase/lanthionine synthetase C family protein [Brevibacillus sp. MS2.2]
MKANMVYYDYLNENSKYFTPNKSSVTEREFNVTNLSDDCVVSKEENSVWKMYMFKEQSLQAQGWKIHISATLDNAEQILQKVSNILVERKVHFKHLASEWDYLTTNSKTANRASSGKFITIYPPSDDDFLNLLDLLYTTLHSFESGPYILSDKCWKNSNVYYRYGGFAMIFNEQGELCMKDENGELLVDERVPYYKVPSFVKEFDQYLDSLNTTSIEAEVENNKFEEYEFQSALRFTNGGGIYLTERKKDKKKVIIKEARPKSGLDGQKVDALERQKMELDALSKLSKVDGIVNILDYFTHWKHSFLVEEYVDGIDLESWIVANYPFINNGDIKVYKNKIHNILTKLVSIVEEMHKNGVGMGDLQPANIIISEDLDVTLIDFETARPKDLEGKPTLITCGFSHPRNKNNGERDWYAIKKILRYCLLPIGPIEDIDSGMYDYQDQWIEKVYGEDFLLFVEMITEKCNQHLSFIGEENRLQAIYKNAMKKDISSIIEGLRNGIEKNFVRSEKLIHGDIRQFESKAGKYNVQNGGTGAALAFFRSGTVSEYINHWIENELMKNIDSIEQSGLLTGKAGIATTLYEIGYKKEAINIFANMNLNSSDISLRSGLSGIGLGLVSLYLEEQDERFLEKAIFVASIIDTFMSEKKELKVQDWAGIPIGIMDGWSGVSLFYSALYAVTKKESYYLKSIECIDKDLEKTKEDKSTLQTIDDSNRLLPYLSGGSVGIGIAIVYLNHVSDKKRYQRELSLITNLYRVRCSFSGGLYDGAGSFLMIPPLLGKSDSEYTNKKDCVIELLRLFLIPKENHILFPGQFCYRLSNDFQTGSSGIILALEGILKDNPLYWLPLINIDDFYKNTKYRQDEVCVNAAPTTIKQ